MSKTIWIALLTLLAPAVAFADAGPSALIPYPDWIVFALALIITAWWSAQAFDRPSINLADIPTYPRYMTRPSQYQMGKFFFVLLSLAIYALMVRYHKDLPQILKVIKPEWSTPLQSLIDQKEPSYLVVIIIVSSCFILLLKAEGEWNFYLLFRDLIHSWVAIPHLTTRIVNLTRDGLNVPQHAMPKLVTSHPEWRVHAGDFEKNSSSMDRAWAELVYLQWWILEQHRIDNGTTFFSEETFNWEDIKSDFERLIVIVSARKDGVGSSDDQSAQIMRDISTHRKRLGRLIACYLVFMNSTRAALIEKARQLGIDLGPQPSENPLRYAAIYIVTLAMAVYFGVYFSAVIYDLINQMPTPNSILLQDTSDVQRWVFLAFGDYGIPILGILTLRCLAWKISPVREHSIIIAYAWIFLIAAFLSTLGLTIMVELVGRYAGQWDQFFSICEREIRWSIGPALICVYINHFLDRQIDPTRPDVERPGEHPLRRVGYAILFTMFVVATALPSIPTIQKPQHGPWDVSKLRFISIGTVFFITIAMALVAQFALVKPIPKNSAASDTPRNSGPHLAST